MAKNRELVAQTTRELSYATSKVVKQLNVILSRLVNYIGGPVDNGTLITKDEMLVNSGKVFDLFDAFFTAIDRTQDLNDSEYTITVGNNFGLIDPVDAAALKEMSAKVREMLEDKITTLDKVKAKITAYKQAFGEAYYDLTLLIQTNDRLNRGLIPYVEMYALDNLSGDVVVSSDDFIAPLKTLFEGISALITPSTAFNWVSSENIDLINGWDAELIVAEINGPIKDIADRVFDATGAVVPEVPAPGETPRAFTTSNVDETKKAILETLEEVA